jgi:hypothetical protein
VLLQRFSAAVARRAGPRGTSRGPPVFLRLGASHVRNRHVDDWTALFHVRNNDHLGPDRRKGVQLDRDDVARLAFVRDADAVRDRFRFVFGIGGLARVTLACSGREAASRQCVLLLSCHPRSAFFLDVDVFRSD